MLHQRNERWAMRGEHDASDGSGGTEKERGQVEATNQAVQVEELVER